MRLQTAPTGPGKNIELPNYFSKPHTDCGTKDYLPTWRGFNELIVVILNVGFSGIAFVDENTKPLCQAFTVREFVLVQQSKVR